jgi:enoyl-CoA hydratase/carnithine racemase
MAFWNQKRFLSSGLINRLQKLQSFRVEGKDGVLKVTFNRPQVANAIGLQMASEVIELTHILKEDKEVKCAVITGKGNAFCTGRDLKESKIHSKADADRFQKLVMDCNVGWQKLEIPTIAAINGHCFGWGLEFSLVCDIRLVWSEATLCLPECGLAIFPGAGGVVTLPRIINPGIAKQLIYTSERFSGKKSVEYGICNQSFATQEELLAHAMEIAKVIANNGPLGVRGAKKVIDEGLEINFDQAIALSNKHRLPLNQTLDFHEALKAFAEKRKPVFKGK